VVWKLSRGGGSGRWGLARDESALLGKEVFAMLEMRTEWWLSWRERVSEQTRSEWYL
jgi:hypothetical protein